MNGVREHLLSRPGLSNQQNGSAGLRRSPRQLLRGQHSPALAENVVKGVLALEDIDPAPAHGLILFLVLGERRADLTEQIQVRRHQHSERPDDFSARTSDGNPLDEIQLPSNHLLSANLGDSGLAHDVQIGVFHDLRHMTTQRILGFYSGDRFVGGRIEDQAAGPVDDHHEPMGRCQSL